jgi:pilus assembly protein CpaB
VNGKSIMMLVVAGVLGLGAMWGTSKLLSKDKGPAPVEMQDVVVAVRNLKIEEVLKPDLLKIEQKQKAAILPGAFTSVKDIENRWVQIGMLEGEQIVEGKLAMKGSPPGLIARIPTGYRAYTIDVNEQTGVSGFVLPDHRVDVVQMLAPAHPGAQAEAETVLQNVLVLASGQTFTRPDDRSIQARTVTLAVAPDQVDTLVAAKQRGPLSLSLRGLNDNTQVVAKKKKEPEKPIEVAVKPAPEPPPPPPPPPPQAPTPEPPPVKPPRFVIIYRGSSDKVERVRIDRNNPDDPEAPIESPSIPN